MKPYMMLNSFFLIMVVTCCHLVMVKEIHGFVTIGIRPGRSFCRTSESLFSSVGKVTAVSSDDDETNQQEYAPQTKETIKADILQPFLPAADPTYAVRGPVGDEEFVIERSGGPTEEELQNENIIKIVRIECTDLEVNTLMWKCLGYRFDSEKEEWTPDLVFPKWLERYPTPPDLIGMRRTYSKEIDQPSLKANQSIVRSIPVEFKQSLKTHLKPLGFTGYQYSELTPNKTRRAQCANWLLYYREELFGYTLEELQERKRLRLQAQAEAEDSAEWKPPVTEVV